MVLRIIKKEKNEMKIELDGEDHTLGNLIQHTLLMDKDIEFAGYDLPHPLSRKPIIYLRTKKGLKVENVFKRTLEKVSKQANEFLANFSKAVEK
ncbi:MAG: DNA-directed RNA polymerase subunit L [Candidatus Bathyarchaeota archaeon]|nr:DNA-directed RNA polymerase subunit L [Candidatus Bathyarchaeota archaeon]